MSEFKSIQISGCSDKERADRLQSCLENIYEVICDHYEETVECCGEKLSERLHMAFAQPKFDDVSEHLEKQFGILP